MPTPTKGPRLGGSPAHERLILANLAQSLFEHGRITTTEAKAKRLRPYAEKLITSAKRGTLHSRREVMKVIRDKAVVHHLFADVAPVFANRNGGYTRIVKTMPRKGDNAPMALIELIMEETVASSANRTTRRAARVQQSSGSTPRGAVQPSAPAEAAPSEAAPSEAATTPDAVGQVARAAGAAGNSAGAVIEEPASVEAGETTESSDVVADNDTPATTVAGDADRIRSDSTQAEQAASEAPAEGGSAVADPADGGSAVADPADGGSAVADPADGGSAVADPADGGSAVADGEQASK